MEKEGMCIFAIKDMTSIRYINKTDGVLKFEEWAYCILNTLSILAAWL